MKKILCLICMTLTLCIAERYGFSQEYIYSIQEPTILREQPTEDADVVLEIPKDEKLIVLEKHGDWIKVLHESIIGYVVASHVTLSIPTPDATFLDIIEFRSQYETNKETMTKIKFKRWWEDIEKSVTGQRIRSQGYVQKAKEGWLEGLHVQIDIDNPSENTGYDVILHLDKEKHQDALVNLIKGMNLQFAGTVESINTSLGIFVIRLDDVEMFFEEHAEQTLEEQPGEQVSEDPSSLQTSSDFLNFVEVFHQYKANKENMTKAAFEAWWEQTTETLKQKEHIRSKGYVYDANDSWTLGLSIELNIFPEAERDKYAKYTSQYSLSMEEKDKPFMATLQKYDEIEFTGNITNFMTSLGFFAAEIQNVTIVNVERQQNTGVNINIPEMSPEHPAFFDFAELQKQYAINEGKLTTFGFETWEEQLKTTIEDNTIHSQGHVVEARSRGENEIEVLLDIHTPPDQRDDAVLMMNKGKNRDMIMELDKGKLITFAGTVTRFKISSKRVSLRMENGEILERIEPKKSKASKETVTDQAITHNDITCKFVVGFVKDGVFLTNNSGQTLHNVQLKITLDEGNATDSFPVWQQKNEKNIFLKESEQQRRFTSSFLLMKAHFLILTLLVINRKKGESNKRNSAYVRRFTA